MDEVVRVNDFTVIQTRTTPDSKSGHYMFAKKESTRVLLVLNVPPYVDENCLVRVFSCCGKVKFAEIKSSTRDKAKARPLIYSKYFDRTRKKSDFKVARIHFVRESAVNGALKLPFNEPLVLSTEESPICSGVEKWLAEYTEDNTCDKKLLKEHVDKYMEKYDRQVQEKLAAEKEASRTPDEDGWVLVTRQGRNKGIPRTQTLEHKIAAKYRLKQKDKELLNFYAFQKTNAKREHLAELRIKFEEDKQKIKQMKAARKFRPY